MPFVLLLLLTLAPIPTWLMPQDPIKIGTILPVGWGNMRVEKYRITSGRKQYLLTPTEKDYSHFSFWVSKEDVSATIQNPKAEWKNFEPVYVSK